MKPRILAIDDDPGRYDHLRRLLGDRAELVIAACPDCVRHALMDADAVLLDYDLDSGEPCPLCLASYGVWASTSKGIAYAARISRIKVPTIVVSCSHAENVARLLAELRDGGPVARIAASETDPEIRWLGQLWAWGVL